MYVYGKNVAKELIKKNNCDCDAIHLDKMNKAVSELEKLEIIDSMALFFKNFSDPTRLKILTILDRVGQMCVCDIAVSLNMTKSAISHQLKYLKDCNLVRSVKNGKEVFYALSDNHVKDIIETGIAHLKEKK